MAEAGIISFPFDEVSERVDFVRSMLPAWGRSLVSSQSEFLIRFKHMGSDLVDQPLSADQFIEKDILKALTERFPDDVINSEESAKLGGDGDFEWWIDPVDGTRNFSRGLPLFCMSLGLCHRGQPVGGVIYAPSLSEMYHTIYGSGAFKNGDPITVSNLGSLSYSLMASGLPYQRREILSELITDIAAFVSTGVGLRRTGSTILDLCWVAEGRIDALWDRGLHPWDLCAAGLLIREAGGQVTGFAGEGYSLALKEIIASNSVLHEAILEIKQKTRRLGGYN
jgi:myo-inositol-1(or 4)-monophosphatase